VVTTLAFGSEGPWFDPCLGQTFFIQNHLFQGPKSYFLIQFNVLILYDLTKDALDTYIMFMVWYQLIKKENYDWAPPGDRTRACRVTDQRGNH